MLKKPLMSSSSSIGCPPCRLRSSSSEGKHESRQTLTFFLPMTLRHEKGRASSQSAVDARARRRGAADILHAMPSIQHTYLLLFRWKRSETTSS